MAAKNVDGIIIGDLLEDDDNEVWRVSDVYPTPTIVATNIRSGMPVVFSAKSSTSKLFHKMIREIPENKKSKKKTTRKS